MFKATFVKDVSHDFTGEARLYATNNPDLPFVVASSVNSGFANETKVFPADGSGNVTDWIRLGVAYPFGQFEAALEDAGFELED